MLQTGDNAPDFTLVSDDGREMSLSDFRGQRVVLYFFPKADTPGCTKQACAVRDIYAQIEAENAQVIGMGPDPPGKLAKFREKYDLPFVLLSDPDHHMAEAYGAWGEKRAFGKTYDGVIRSHFAIDEEGRIADFKVNVRPLTTADLALRLVQL
ncbi:MAG: thioredoxin-dependent thiol peroxidase [Anaerolineae bacterium]|jgi:peroxiredoxin Q/BCP